MRRRAFIAGLVGTAIRPLTAQAQQPGHLPTIGFLGTDTSSWRPYVAAFVEQLRELGWMERRTVTIEYRWSEGRPERVAETVAEFLRLKVDLIFTSGFAVAAFKQATTVTPIVFPIAPDPVRGKLVESLARPGGNVTGLTVQSPDLAGKRIALLREVVPELRRLAIIGDADFPQSVLEMREVAEVTRTLGIEMVPLDVRGPEDVVPALKTLQADALYIIATALLGPSTADIVALTRAARVPTILGFGSWVRAGCLMSYGPDIPDLFRRSAGYVDKILRGAKPSDLPVEQPTKFEFMINLKTAKAMGLTIPESLLARADEVIE